VRAEPSSVQLTLPSMHRVIVIRHNLITLDERSRSRAERDISDIRGWGGRGGRHVGGVPNLQHWPGYKVTRDTLQDDRL